MRQVYWEFWDNCCGRMWTVRIGTRASFLTNFLLLFSSVQMCSGLQTLKPCKFRSWMPTFWFRCWFFFIHHATLLNVEFNWVLYHTCRPHGQETLADVYKSIRPEELATLAPQHHCDMLDYVGSMWLVFCALANLHFVGMNFGTSLQRSRGFWKVRCRNPIWNAVTVNLRSSYFVSFGHSTADFFLRILCSPEKCCELGLNFV